MYNGIFWLARTLFLSYKQLTYDQRIQIFILKRAGHPQAKVAELMDVSQPTISRLYKKFGGLNGYNAPDIKLFEAERKKAVVKKKKLTPIIINIIEQKLREKWSPEQISGWLKQEIAFNISHQTIYVHIRKDKAAGGKLYLNLRRKGKRYKVRSKVDRIKIKERVSIHEREKIVELKQRIGDWEIDLMHGKGYSGVLVTIVDRVTKFTVCARVSNKTAKAVTEATIALLEPYKDTVLTLTSDNGTEFAHHKEIAKKLALLFYFCDPFNSGQRGVNEHTNGLLRQYWPKNHDFKKISPEEVVAVVEQLNDRPRLKLGFKTPSQMMQEHLDKSDH